MNSQINWSSKSGNNSMLACGPFVNEQAMNNPFVIPSFDEIEMSLNSMNTFQYHQQVFKSNIKNKEIKNISPINSIFFESGNSNSSSPITCCIPSPSTFNRKIQLSKNEIFSLQPLSMDQKKERIKLFPFSQENTLGSLNLNLGPPKEPFQISSVITYKEKGQCLKICNIIKILRKYYKLCNIPLKAKSIMKSLRLESAKKLGMKKKTLDDYAMFLKWGIRLGFPFEENLNMKFGFLRCWVKVHENYTGKKTELRNEYDSVNLIDKLSYLNTLVSKRRNSTDK